jgi:hypothetical protein
MVAVPETGVSAAVVMTAAERPVVPVRDRRAVAVAVSAMELLRPESDLARLLESFGSVDLLLAAEDTAPGPCAVGVLGPADADPVDGPGAEGLLENRDDEDEDDDDLGYDDLDEVRRGVAALEIADLQLHRLCLRLPFGAGADGDLVAAMSELVGFDPEPGVYCLAPAPSPSDPARAVVNGAAQRIAQVYGIPLLRYRCLELSVVGEDTL